MNRARRTPGEIAHLCEEFRRSGITQRAFAERHGVHVATVRYWLTCQHSRKPQAVARFVEVQTAVPPPALQESFLLELPRGVRLHFSQQPDPGYLASIVRALQNL